jgi:hypothetical protein
MTDAVFRGGKAMNNLHAAMQSFLNGPRTIAADAALDPGPDTHEGIQP